MYGLMLWFLCLSMAEFCSSSAVIEIHLIRFNSSGLLSTKKCCDSPTLTVCPANQCDPQVFFCLQDFSGQGCPVGNVSTGYTSDTDSIIFSDVIGDARTPNPMMLHVENYPGVVIAKVTIYDHDMHEGAPDNEKMDYSQYVYSFEPDTNGTRHRTSLIPLVGATSTLDVEISVHCDQDYYGSKCDVKCVSDPLRYCDKNGVLLCRPGKICTVPQSTPVKTTPITTETMTTSIPSTVSSTLSMVPLTSPSTSVNTVSYTTSISASTPTKHVTLSRITTATAGIVTHSPVTSKPSQIISTTVMSQSSQAVHVYSQKTSKSSQTVSTPVTSETRQTSPEKSKSSQTVPTPGTPKTGQTVSITAQKTITWFYHSRTSTNNLGQTNSTTNSLHQKASFTLVVKTRGSTTESLKTSFEGHKCIFSVSENDSFSVQNGSFSALEIYVHEIIRTDLNESSESIQIDVQETYTEDGIRKITVVLIDKEDGSSINTSRLIDIARRFCSQVTARAYQIAKGEKSDILTVVVPTVICGLIVLLGLILTYFLCRRKCMNRKVDSEHKAETKSGPAKELSNSEQ